MVGDAPARLGDELREAFGGERVAFGGAVDRREGGSIVRVEPTESRFSMVGRVMMGETPLRRRTSRSCEREEISPRRRETSSSALARSLRSSATCGSKSARARGDWRRGTHHSVGLLEQLHAQVLQLAHQVILGLLQLCTSPREDICTPP